MNDRIERLEQALEQLGAEYEPPRGWEARVLAAVSPRPKRRWWWLAIPAVALVLAVMVVPRTRTPRPVPLALAVERIPGMQPVRGDMQVGDRIRVGVRGGSGHQAIWVFRGETELVGVCPEGKGCQSSAGTLTLELTLDRIGSYRVIALTAAGGLPIPRGAYDADLAAAMAVDATSRQELLDVE
jgi:hypothetical protein